jgi:hypothetical protein
MKSGGSNCQIEDNAQRIELLTKFEALTLSGQNPPNNREKREPREAWRSPRIQRFAGHEILNGEINTSRYNPRKSMQYRRGQSNE